MEAILTQKLIEYAAAHHPELEPMSLNEIAGTVMPLVFEMVDNGYQQHEIEQRALSTLITALGVSKFDYLLEVLEADFSNYYLSCLEAGILKFELLNILEACEGFFSACPLTEENEGDPFLRYRVIATIDNYLQG